MSIGIVVVSEQNTWVHLFIGLQYQYFHRKKKLKIQADGYDTNRKRGSYAKYMQSKASSRNDSTKSKRRKRGKGKRGKSKKKTARSSAAKMSKDSFNKGETSD